MGWERGQRVPCLHRWGTSQHCPIPDHSANFPFKSQRKVTEVWNIRSFFDQGITRKCLWGWDAPIRSALCVYDLPQDSNQLTTRKRRWDEFLPWIFSSYYIYVSHVKSYVCLFLMPCLISKRTQENMVFFEVKPGRRTCVVSARKSATDKFSSRNSHTIQILGKHLELRAALSARTTTKNLTSAHQLNSSYTKSDCPKKCHGTVHI